MNYRKYLNNAITDLEGQIELLKEQGFRHGHILPNPTSSGTMQHHWINGGKKVYIKKALLPTYRQECQRGSRIAELQDKIEVLRTL